MTKQQKKNLTPWLLALPSFGLGLAWNMKSTVLPLLVKSITTSNFKLGLLTTVGPIAGIIFPYLAGVISDRTNLKIGKRKPWVLVGGFLSAIFLVALGYSPNYILMFIFAFGSYAALNFFQGAYNPWMPEAVEENEIGRVNGLSKLVYSLGGMLFFFTAVKLFNINKSFPFLLILVCVLVPLLITTILVKEDDSKFKEPSKISLDFLKNLPVMRVFMTVFFFYAAYGLITPFWIPYFSATDHFSGVQISYALIGFTIVGLVLSVFIGNLCDKLNKQYILLTSCILYAIAFILGWFVKDLANLWVFAIISGAAFIILQISFYAIIPEIVPKEKIGEYMGINNVFICVPQIVTSLLGGYLLSIHKGFLIFPISITFAIIGCIIIGYGKLIKKTTATT
ncbi:MAG: MFS transporter [Sarcina sp.]